MICVILKGDIWHTTSQKFGDTYSVFIITQFVCFQKKNQNSIIIVFISKKSFKLQNKWKLRILT